MPVKTDADFKQHAVHVDFEALLLRCSVAMPAIPQKAEMHKELAKQKEDRMVSGLSQGCNIRSCFHVLF